MVKTVQTQFTYPERFSRGILLLKTFLGLLIMIPHLICLWAISIAAGFVALISWFVVLFTGKYPQSMFKFMVGFANWALRVRSYFNLLCDAYPPFGFEKSYPITFNVTYPEKLSRGVLILRLLFGWIYVMIPHGFCLFFRCIAHLFVLFIA